MPSRRAVVASRCARAPIRHWWACRASRGGHVARWHPDFDSRAVADPSARGCLPRPVVRLHPQATSRPRTSAGARELTAPVHGHWRRPGSRAPRGGLRGRLGSLPDAAGRPVVVGNTARMGSATSAGIEVRMPAATCRPGRRTATSAEWRASAPRCDHSSSAMHHDRATSRQCWHGEIQRGIGVAAIITCLLRGPGGGGDLRRGQPQTEGRDPDCGGLPRHKGVALPDRLAGRAARP